MVINYDLENSPLQIKTGSVVGSNEKVEVQLFNAGGHYAGTVNLFFSSPPQYWLRWCNTFRTNFPTLLPHETDRVWTITLSKTSGERRVVITCNDKEVLNFVMSNTSCSVSTWSKYWDRSVKKIYFFSNSDTASNFYRPGKEPLFVFVYFPENFMYFAHNS